MQAPSDSKMYFTCAHMCTKTAWGLFIQIHPTERSHFGKQLQPPHSRRTHQVALENTPQNTHFNIQRQRELPFGKMRLNKAEDSDMLTYEEKFMMPVLCSSRRLN